MGGASMSSKVVRMMLKELSSKIEGTLTPIAKLKLEASFTHDGQTFLCYFS